MKPSVPCSGRMNASEKMSVDSTQAPTLIASNQIESGQTIDNKVGDFSSENTADRLNLATRPRPMSRFGRDMCSRS